MPAALAGQGFRRLEKKKCSKICGEGATMNASENRDMSPEMIKKMEAFRKSVGMAPRGERPAPSPSQGNGTGSGTGTGTGTGTGKASGAALQTGTVPARKKTKPNKHENRFMTDLMILRNSLCVHGEAVRERLETVNPHGWRDLRLLLSLVCRIQDQMLETMPDSRSDYYATLARSGRYHLEIEGPVRQGHTVLIGDKHLSVILDAVMETECLLCMKDGKEIEKCPFREAMLEVAPPSEMKEDGRIFRCEYYDAARQLVRNEDVDI